MNAAIRPSRSASAAQAFPPVAHDHGACMARALERATAALAGVGLRMTPLRARVLEEVSASHAAVGAYDILERLAAKGQRLAPISVYRALDALQAAGIVHKLESRNAFFACHVADGHAEERARPCLVLVCSGCGRVAETPGPRVWTAIDAAVAAVGFAFEGSLLEVTGRCGPCAGPNAGAA